MNRRCFLKYGGLALFAGGGVLRASANPLRQPVAGSAKERDVLIVIFLRGGLDGMHALVPYQSSEYYQARPNLAVPLSATEGTGLVLNETFALNPALKALFPLFQQGHLAPICAVGTSDRSRSHFVAQDYLEFGGEQPRDGWLNRQVSDSGIALSTKAQLPTLLKGQNPVLNATSLDDLGSITEPPALFAGSAPVARLTQDEKRFKQRLSKLKTPDKSSYPKTRLGEQLATVAHLLKQGVELEAVHCEMSGFDSHSRQVDGLWPGRMLGLNSLLHEFAQAVDIFWRDLGDIQERVTLMTITEFGRRLGENASLGTDHGFASCAFLLGGGVSGGKVYGRWPGLRQDQLVEGIDLEVTTDYRQILNEYNRAMSQSELFADFSGPNLGLFST